jgi:hypothetical protein
LLLSWKGDRPELYVNTFHREIPTLAALGMIEFASAAYGHFDHMAQLIAGVLALADDDPRRGRFDELRRHHAPDLRGGHHYVDSPRHANYVDAETYEKVLEQVRARVGLDPWRARTPTTRTAEPTGAR